MRIRTLLSAILMLFAIGANAQIVINEFQPDLDQVEIKNLGMMEVPVGNYFLCSFPVYTEIEDMTIVSGDLNLGPGEILVVAGHLMGDSDDELGLYILPQYSNSGAIIDYVEWGSSGHVRASVAIGAEIWSMGDFIPTVNAGESVQWDGEGDTSDDWFLGDDTFGAENIAGCDAEGGTISTDDPTEICVGDGIADPINVTLEGASGSNSAWVITDDQANILALPEGGPFDLEEAGGGVCLIWHLSFEDGLLGAEVGMNANDLEGCYTLSNPITVIRNGVAGGTISTEDETTICALDGEADPINVTLEGAEGSNFAWVITDDLGNILDLPANGPFDFDGAGEGVCLIWHLSFEDGLEGAEVGMNANDLEGCYSLSNPITVTRLVGEDCDCNVDGGTLTTENENNTFEICTGDGIADPIDVTLEGNEGQNSQWVITDDEGTILALPAGGPFDLDGAGPGTCLIWHLSFDDGLIGAEVGLNANDLEGCYSLSNPVTVIRNEIAGGTVSTSDGETMVTVIVGDGDGDGDGDEFEFASAESEGENFVFIVTDPSGEIIDILDGNTADFEGAPAGICYVYGFSYYGTLEAEVENNIADITSTEDCYQISENFVTIDRQPVGVYEARVNALKAWPNPVNEAVTIDLPEALQNAQLTIYNTQGQIVLTTQMSGSGNQQVNVSQLATGTYHLHLTNGDQTYRIALLKP
ncbi:MAG: T9SS type A sorting domain-containing protein [Flavobacteriales bacterium]|nr:T9SS type A sorting domain-containing protein [Flavobacteriales bacterium]